MTIGVFSRTFSGDGLTAVLQQVALAGFDAVHLSLASAGLDALPMELPGEVATGIDDAVRANELAVVGVSATFNAAHPDPDQRADGLARACTVIDAAPTLGADFVSLCTGSRSPLGMWTYDPANGSAEAWRDSRATLTALAERAERAGVLLGVEPERANVVDGAQAARRMLDEIRSPAMRIIFDGANLVSPGTSASDQRSVFAEAFDLLGADIAIVHAKDHDATGASCRIGTGEVQFAAVVDLIRRNGMLDAVPVVTHNLPPVDVPAAAGYLENLLTG